MPTHKPSLFLSQKPSTVPTHKPSLFPSQKPSSAPTHTPSLVITQQLSSKPTQKPSSKPTNKPSSKPTNKPSSKPTNKPSSKPTNKPSHFPSNKPSSIPTVNLPNTTNQFTSVSVGGNEGSSGSLLVIASAISVVTMGLVALMSRRRNGARSLPIEVDYQFPIALDNV